MRAYFVTLLSGIARTRASYTFSCLADVRAVRATAVECTVEVAMTVMTTLPVTTVVQSRGFLVGCVVGVVVALAVILAAACVDYHRCVKQQRGQQPVV